MLFGISLNECVHYNKKKTMLMKEMWENQPSMLTSLAKRAVNKMEKENYFSKVLIEETVSYTPFNCFIEISNQIKFYDKN